MTLALRLTVPIFFAYFSIGVVYGVIFTHSGFAWYLAPLISAIVFAGSVQFVALSMMSEHATVFAVIIATVFIAFRNAFYGLSFLDRYKTGWLAKSVLVFTLVDATYAILTANPPKQGLNDIKFCLSVSLLNFVYWVAGTFLGAVMSCWIPEFDALKFVLPAFFMTVVVGFFLKSRQWHAIVAPILCMVIAYFIWPAQYFLLAILFSIITIFF